MNRKLRSLIVRAAVMAMIVGLLPSTSITARADTDPVPLVFSDSIVLTGGTIALDCLPANVGACVGAPNLPLVGGLGTFTFKVKTCEATSDPSTDIPGNLQDLMPFNCNVPGGWTSSGSYSNTVCGTGTARGTIAGPIGPAGEQLQNISYWITFVGGLGTLTGNVTEVDGPSEIYAASLTGSVGLSPLSPPNGNNCTNGFKVTAKINVFEDITAS